MIVDDNSRNIPIETSNRTFPSMEEAYDAGQRRIGEYPALARLPLRAARQMHAVDAESAEPSIRREMVD